MASSPLPPLSENLLLPDSVEELLETIRRDQSLPPPDTRARWELARLGEEASLQILKQMSDTRIKNLSALIVYMARNSNVAQARNAEAVCSQESVCFSGPKSPNLASLRGDSSADSSGFEMLQYEMPRRQTTSQILVALEELEFRKAFLILSYAGRSNLEEIISIDLIKKLNCLPMVSFEAELWNIIGSKCISESDRRKNLDWDSRKTHIYQCHVDPQGNFTFKGPYLQVTRTHLHRVLGDDNVLLVKFAEESCGTRPAQSLDSFSLVYHRIAKEGIPVGLRRYHFFVFKDGGKEEKKKSPTSSAVKCYFVRTDSNSATDANKPFSLILSKTIKSDIDLASVNIERIEDIPCMDEVGRFVYNEDGELMIHTDGTGYISEDLAMQCPKSVYKGHYLVPRDFQKILDGLEVMERPPSLRQFFALIGEPPLLIQFRLFNNGCAVKGTLLVDKRISDIFCRFRGDARKAGKFPNLIKPRLETTVIRTPHIWEVIAQRQLPPKTIRIRPSMIKVETDPNISAIQSCNSLEIVGTSNQPKRTCLSKSLIALLHYGGVPKEYFLELLMNALHDARDARYNKQAALRVALRYGDMDDFLVSRMILCGVPLDEPYLQFRLLVMMREERKGLQGGKIPVSDCYYLMGTADPTGTLEPNEVSGDVLVYKHPGLHFGDIHMLTATYIKDLEKIVGNAKYAIFFPTKGLRSLADEMANSDYDGDIYWVSKNPQLLEYFKASKPWVQRYSKPKILQRKPTEFSSTDLERELFQQYLVNRFKPSYTISAASDCWMAFMDRLLTLSDQCAKEKQCLIEKILKLTDIYYVSLDAGKDGLKVEVPDELKAKMYPHFMERSNSYRSTSILGLIYDKVVSFQIEDPLLDEVWKLPCLSEEAPQSCLRLWMERYDKYRKEMTQAMRLEKESKDLAAKEIIQKYKTMLYGAEEFEQSPRKQEDIFDEALAIYQIVYNYTNSKTDKAVGRCSFAWNVAGHALCMLHAKKQGEDNSIVCLKSVLREVLG